MSAKEMFEKLGYKLREYSDELFYYYPATNGLGNYTEIGIRFDLKNKRIFLDNATTIPEMEAINKQIEELGW